MLPKLYFIHEKIFFFDKFPSQLNTSPEKVNFVNQSGSFFSIILIYGIRASIYGIRASIYGMVFKLYC